MAHTLADSYVSVTARSGGAAAEQAAVHAPAILRVGKTRMIDLSYGIYGIRRWGGQTIISFGQGARV